MTELIVFCLATGRLSYMLLYEDGPFDVLRMIRRTFRAQEFGPGGNYELLREDEVNDVLSGSMDQNVIGKALSCYYCTSIWVAAFCYLIALSDVDFLLWILAASAMAIVWKEFIDGNLFSRHSDSA